jgi:NADPH-dependent 7-cyano-7-deazaguanine reductase QueF
MEIWEPKPPGTHWACYRTALLYYINWRKEEALFKFSDMNTLRNHNKHSAEFCRVFLGKTVSQHVTIFTASNMKDHKSKRACHWTSQMDLAHTFITYFPKDHF